MPLLKFPRFQLPPSPAALACIALAFVLPGLAGHDPWKSHDALGVGIVWQMALSDDPIVPRIADLAWLGVRPVFASLSAEPRFAALLTRMALPERPRN